MHNYWNFGKENLLIFHGPYNFEKEKNFTSLPKISDGFFHGQQCNFGLISHFSSLGLLVG